ncbi:Palmitoyl-acyl carrier protein thioesterase, chloroplastic [Morella rubra]|uniref:Acyl-[acyl-carrier-protein] hydrolase n=1 Tax=Morella rubra TaxID=262757 RepID=A0A6A1UIU0_9ROSI|nr:Palmitoyl-acyl carrier protein thioesterase, chloroplastic [Morella rubra]
MRSKSASSLQVKANAQTPTKINGSSVGLTTPMESVKNECETSSHAPRTFINTLPDWSMLLAAITTIFLAAEKQWMMLDWKPRRSGMLIDPFGLGSIETALNHVKGAGLLGDGFGSTPEMCEKNLIWVVTRMQVVVDRYPTWGDVVQVGTWVSRSGKNGMRRDWLLRDYNTGETLIRASR